MIKNILLAAALAAVSHGAQASTNVVQNGGLDGVTSGYVYNGVAPSIQAAMPGFGYTDGVVQGWTGSFVSIASGNGAWGSPSTLPGGGSQLGGSVAGIQADGTLSQLLTLDAGTYVLTWLDANRYGGSNQSYAVSFNGDALSTTAFDTTVGGGWHQESLTFTVAEQTTGDLTFAGLKGWTTGDATAFIDNVSLSAVPEPTSTLMLAIGVLGLVAWRRRAQV